MIPELDFDEVNFIPVNNCKYLKKAIVDYEYFTINYGECFVLCECKNLNCCYENYLEEFGDVCPKCGGEAIKKIYLLGIDEPIMEDNINVD